MDKKQNSCEPHGGKYMMIADNSEGYEKLDDKIWPAPCTARSMDEICARQDGLDAYIQSMNRYIVEQFRVIAADHHNWWKRATQKYGLDPTKIYRWNQADGNIELIAAEVDAASKK